MSVDLITYAFTAGEISPQLYGRTDYEQYDLALSTALNFFIDYRGGISSRPGSIFLDYLQYDEQNVRLYEFQFAPDLANTYVLVFGDNYVRFVQNNGYVLEASKNISAITQADPGVVTSAAHGFSNDQWVKITGVGGMTELNGQTFWLRNVTTDTFELYDFANRPVDTSLFAAYTSGGIVERIYTVTTPYGAEDLDKLRVHQVRNELRLTHPDYPPYTLTREDQTDWTLAETSFSDFFTRPSIAALTPSSAGSAGVAYAVTAVDANGRESLPSNVKLNTATVNFTSTDGRMVVDFTSVVGAVRYNIYRSIVVADGDFIDIGYTLGYLGSSRVNQFVDENIIPDFTRSPPTYGNPFANGQALYFDVINQGSGYGRDDTTISLSGGTGFQGQVIVNDAGAVTGVLIIFPGEGYTDSSTVTISGTGTGANLTVTTSSNDGNQPALSIIHQQRQVYAATANQPLTIFGSRPRDYTNFSVSDAQVADDSYEYDLDSQEVTPIRHLLSIRGGLLIGTEAGIWLLRGEDGPVVSATSAYAEPQSATGMSEVEPLLIDSDILYVEAAGTTVRLLKQNEYSEIYKGEDVGILSNHLFGAGRNLERWTFAVDPSKLVWGVREDGTMLAETIVPEQKIFGWTRHETFGRYLDIRSVREGRTFGVYQIVERLINGRRTKFLEKHASREFTRIEDAWCVDCGLDLPMPEPAASITFSASFGEDVTATASANVFASGDVGKVIRAGGGIGEITAFTSATVVTMRWYDDAPMTDVLKQDPDRTPNPQAQGSWTMTAPVSSVGGLWHLEGATVSILADGSVKPQQVVTNGSVSLPNPASRIIIGLPYECVAATLSPIANDAVIEARRKRNIGVAVRKFDTVGLQVGDSLDDLYEMKERTLEAWGRPTIPFNGIDYITIDAGFEEESSVFFVQSNPLPATILGYVLATEVGDDPG